MSHPCSVRCIVTTLLLSSVAALSHLAQRFVSPLTDEVAVLWSGEEVCVVAVQALHAVEITHTSNPHIALQCREARTY